MKREKQAVRLLLLAFADDVPGNLFENVCGHRPGRHRPGHDQGQQFIALSGHFFDEPAHFVMGFLPFIEKGRPEDQTLGLESRPVRLDRIEGVGFVHEAGNGDAHDASPVEIDCRVRSVFGPKNHPSNRGLPENRTHLTVVDMRFGYNTNGFAHHRFEDALAILAELGYRSVAITLDHHVLNPFEPGLPDRIAETRKLLEKLKLRCVIETGARFLLDARRKHQPTLISPRQEERKHRLEFLELAVEIASELNADAFSFWSGTPVDEMPFST